MYELGDLYPAALDVFDQNRQLANPAAATLVITQPDQTAVTPVLTLPPAETGKLRYLFPTVQPGRHLTRWVVTMAGSTPSKAYTDVFDVLAAAPPSILSLADAKQTLSMDPAYTDDDDELRGKLRGITASVERYMRTVYAYRQVTEIIERPRMGVPWTLPASLRLTYVPVISLTSLVTLRPDSTVLTTYDTVNDMWVDPESGLVHRTGGPPFAGRMQAVYAAGMRVIPENVIEGSRVLLQAVWETRRGPGGVNGVVGPEEMSDYRHYTALPRKCIDWLGPPRPVVY
jgi:hypothetical protein